MPLYNHRILLKRSTRIMKPEKIICHVSKSSNMISFLSTGPKLLYPLHSQSDERRSTKCEMLCAKRHIFCVVKNTSNDFSSRGCIEQTKQQLCSQMNVVLLNIIIKKQSYSNSTYF